MATAAEKTGDSASIQNFASQSDEAARVEREDAVYAAASQNAATVAAAGITNGMASDAMRERILAIAAPGGVK